MIDDRYITEAKRKLQAEDIAIAEARNRQREAARNEQTSLALYELQRLAEQEIIRLQEENERQRFDILAMNQSLDLMREEKDRLRKDAEVGAAIQRAAAELPARYIIGISVEADAATVELCFPTGHIKTMDVDGDNRLAAEINAAIDAARGGK